MGAAAHDRKGHLPKDTQLTPINPLPEDVAKTAPGDAVRPWNTLNADEKKLFARMAEVYAGFSEYTDAQVGPHHRVSRKDQPAREHTDLLLRRQRRIR